MSSDTEKRRRKRRKKVDVQMLRRDLLATASRYLEEVPLQELNGSMLKAISEIVSSVGPEYSKNERSASPLKALTGLSMPFAAPDGSERDTPSAILPHPGAATPANGYPSVPPPTLKGSGGGIKDPMQDVSYTGLSRPE